MNRSYAMATATLLVAGCAAKIPGLTSSGGSTASSNSASSSSSSGSSDSGSSDSGSSSSVGASSDNAGGGNCTPQADKAARIDGLTGPCWDPPGESTRAQPVHVVAGMRKMKENLYWFDMPEEARVAGDGWGEIPSGFKDWWQNYWPYSASPDALYTPDIPDFEGQTLDAALAALDRLDAPLYVRVITLDLPDSRCSVTTGKVCTQNFDAHRALLNLGVAGAAPPSDDEE